MKVEIWSDYVCPFCYMGEEKFKLGLEEFENKEEVEIIHKSFQLNAEFQQEIYGDKDIHQIIADKYNISYSEAKLNNDRIVDAASNVGLNYNFDILKPNNTQLAHEITKFAQELGRDNEFIQLCYKKYFGEGMDIGNKDQLFEIAKELGFNITSLEEQLLNGKLTELVKKDKEQSDKIGISSVPYFVINNKYAVSGAQSPEHFKAALIQAKNESKN